MGQPPDDRNHEAADHRRTGHPARPDQKPVRPVGREDGGWGQGAVGTTFPTSVNRVFSKNIFHQKMKSLEIASGKFA